jgi:predicted ester cyclase
MSKLRTLVEKHYENVADGRFDREDDIFNSDVVTVEPGAGTIHGLEGFKQYEQAFRRAFPDGRLRLESAVEEGGHIVVEGRFTGTHAGPLAGPAGEIPPTHRPLDLAFADVFEVVGDRVTKHRLYYDQVSFMSQLGLARG